MSDRQIEKILWQCCQHPISPEKWPGYRKHWYLINFAYNWSKKSYRFPFSSGLTNEYDGARTHSEWQVILNLKTILKLPKKNTFKGSTFTVLRALGLFVDSVMKTPWWVFSKQGTKVILKNPNT